MAVVHSRWQLWQSMQTEADSDISEISLSEGQL